MRQVGLLAAAGVYALENNVERLREDHDNAARFADLFRGCRGLAVDYDAAAGTNLLYVHCPGGVVDPLELLRRLEEVRLLILSPHFLYMQPHRFNIMPRAGYRIRGRRSGTRHESDGNYNDIDYNTVN